MIKKLKKMLVLLCFVCILGTYITNFIIIRYIRCLVVEKSMILWFKNNAVECRQIFYNSM